MLYGDYTDRNGWVLWRLCSDFGIDITVGHVPFLQLFINRDIFSYLIE